MTQRLAEIISSLFSFDKQNINALYGWRYIKAMLYKYTIFRVAITEV